MTIIDPNLAPERLAGFDLGTNLKLDNVFRDNDGARLKLSYFDNDIGSFSADVSGTSYTNVEFCRTSANCENSSLAEYYATNQVPPKYSASLTLTQRLLDDHWTLKGEYSLIDVSGSAELSRVPMADYEETFFWNAHSRIDKFGLCVNCKF